MARNAIHSHAETLRGGFQDIDQRPCGQLALRVHLGRTLAVIGTHHGLGLTQRRKQQAQQDNRLHDSDIAWRSSG